MNSLTTIVKTAATSHRSKLMFRLSLGLAAMTLGFVASMRSAYAAETTYYVEIRTGCLSGAGTDANVSIDLLNLEGYTTISTAAMRLDNPSINDFERGRTDSFRVVGKNVGTIRWAVLRHNNSGGGPGWLVRDVRVYNYATGKWANFPVQRWLAKDSCDGATTLFLTPDKRPYCTPYYYGSGSGC